MSAYGGGVKAGIDAGKENDEIFSDEIWNNLVFRRKELGFGGFPRDGQCRIHRAKSLRDILLPRKKSAPRQFLEEHAIYLLWRNCPGFSDAQSLDRTGRLVLHIDWAWLAEDRWNIDDLANFEPR
jgi:hypothetical protein